MSEADSPNDQPAPASIESSELSEQGVTAHSAVTVGLPPAADDGWQTVDFPGAISVDALPQHQTPPHQLEGAGDASEPGVIYYSSAEIAPTTSYVAAISSETFSTSTPLQQLQDENTALRDRLAQVELDLVQHQIEQQLELACRTQAETTPEAAVVPTVVGQLSTVEPTVDRLHQLLQALERSHQTAQRQQILVETLTEQLESSQERIAQLERDCALTQQRHNEQVQQVLQAENACRDLRLRLHRQQQQTLQFKAALEKCLEVPTVYGNQSVPAIDFGDGAAAPEALSALLKPKNQPVKPWSLLSQADQLLERDQAGLPKPLFKLVQQNLSEQSDESDSLRGDRVTTEFNTPFGGDNQGSVAATPADLSALLNSNDPQLVTHLMQLIFPGDAEEQAHQTPDALQVDRSQADAIFNLSPLRSESDEESLSTSSIASDAIASQTRRLPEQSTDAAPTTPSASIGTEQQQTVLSDAEVIVNVPSLTPPDAAPDPLWRDLETVIDPQPLASSATVAAVEVDSCSDVPVDHAQTTENSGIPPMFTALQDAPALEAAVKTPIDSIAPSVNAWTWRDRLVSQNKPLHAPMTDSLVTEPINNETTPQSVSKLLALSGRGQSSVPQQVVGSSQAEPTPTSFATATPSPIVYPSRSTKKLVSLAAVDLPTFPRH